MHRFQYVLIGALLLISICDQSIARKFGRGGSHTYPKSGGLSGSHSSGSHSYPHSGGLSGSGGHGYPSSGSNHGYPSSGSNHGYPASGNSHGYPSSSNSHGYPASGGLSGTGSGHGYPSNSQSNGHSYPSSGGLSGNSRPTGGHTTVNNNYHYHYSPPQQIKYAPTHGGPPVSYPVYHGSPPSYVYQVQNSGSKYSSLLAGLALFNLGALAGGAYSHYSHKSYKPQPGEVCKFGIRKDNGDYEETKIDCNLITSFIFQADASASGATNNNSTVVSTTVTNVTIVNTTNGGAEVPVVTPETSTNYTMLSNGTLVPIVGNESVLNETTANESSTNKPPADASSDGSVASSVTVTTTNTTIVNAVDVKGPPVSVTPGMQCYVIRHTPSSNMKKSVPCGLLQTYAKESLKSSGAQIKPLFSLIGVVVALLISS